MEVNRSNLIRLIENANEDNLVVLDRWPSDRNYEGGFFIMSAKTERLLAGSTSNAVVSSRLPKILDQHQAWFDAIRTVGVNLGRSDEILLTSDNTATDRYCRRIADLFCLECVSIKLLTLEKLNKVLICDQCSDLSSNYTVYFVAEEKTQADLLLGQIADTLYALSINSNGNVHKSLKRRLTIDDTNPRTFIMHDDGLTKAKVRESLISLGGIDWLLLTKTNHPPSEKRKPKNRQRISLSDLEESEYLIHWTRARCGPWPDQSETNHLDDLIFGESGGRHGDVFALCRILASQRIIGSSDLIRSTSPTVCFSDVPMSEIRERTVFRKHLQRWDFLPFGIAIRRKILIERFGCRPVIYGDPKKWESLSPKDRPFFQVAQSSDRKIDWQQEREWRVVGDVDLRRIDLRDAVVFAGDESDLSKLSELSLFDLIVI